MLPVALLATFGAIVVGGYAVQVSMAERRRVARLVDMRIGRETNVRETDLDASFVRRVLLPAASLVGGMGFALTPAAMRRRIQEKLVLAGSPRGWDSDKVVGVKLIGLFAGAGLAEFVGTALGASVSLRLGGAILFGLVGFTVPTALLGQRVMKRQDSVRKALADTIDLLIISVEAGLGFDSALAQVVRNVPGPLSEEIGRMLHEMQLGVGRTDALKHLAERARVDELDGFVLAMVQADRFGVSVGRVLRSQAKELRTKRRQRAEGQAMKTPVKLIFPLIFCILPALFVVIVGPGIIKIAADLFGVHV